ncbi:MAG: MFS transporter [Planctomycetota bacterium]|nr:MFS transporter [Planctomycetota bacterium]
MTGQKSATGISNRGFIALLATMSCGAINDNVYRGMLLLAVVGNGVWAGQLGEGGTGPITLMLYLPFVLLLGFTGLLADRYPKRRVIVGSRIVELILAFGVVGGMAIQSLPIACVLLVLLASQSAFFSPAKYGSVPELVDSTLLSRANGALSLLTNVSIVAGLAVAGFLMDAGESIGLSGLIFVGIVMVGVATIGLISSLFLPHQPAAKPSLPMSFNGFRTYWRTLKAMRGTDLAAATIAWCLFYAVGSLIISIIPNYKEELNLSDSQTSFLLGAATLGIAVGGAAIGIGSGRSIRSSFIPFGAACMGICFFILGLFEPSYIGVLILLSITGLSAGVFVVPILALLQHLPIPGFRARCVGTANFMTYLAMSISALAYWILAEWLGALPPIWFIISGGFMVVVTVWLILLMPRLRRGALAESFGTVHDVETS